MIFKKKSELTQGNPTFEYIVKFYLIFLRNLLTCSLEQKSDEPGV